MAAVDEPEVARDAPSAPGLSVAHAALAGALVLVGIWAYSGTFAWLWHAWMTEPDYSHGVLVPLFALTLAAMNRGKAPAFGQSSGAFAVVWFAFAAFFMVASALFFVDALRGWSLIAWLFAMGFAVGGRKWMAWAWRYIAFLIFMVPLPYRFEHALSLPLQTVATNTSCWILQSLTLPAIAEGHTIYVNDVHLEVVQACSGLRMFMSIIAVAFAFLMLYRRPWWYAVTVLVATGPIAILANAIRITVTGILGQFITSKAGQKWVHDGTGWMMIPVAMLMFFLLLLFLDNLFVEVRPLDIRDPLKRRRRVANRADETDVGVAADA